MIVIDCCAAVEIAKKTARGNALRTLMMNGEEAIAPDLFACEVANTAWKLCSFGHKNIDEGRRLAKSALAQVDDLVPTNEYYEEAFTEACRYGHPVYDFFYLLLAKRNNATLFTVDKKLVALCEEMGVNVVAEIDF